MRNFVQKAKYFAVPALVLVASAAHAEVTLDASIDTALADLLATGQAMSAKVMPVVLGILALIMGIKLVKRFFSKAG